MDKRKNFNYIGINTDYLVHNSKNTVLKVYHLYNTLLILHLKTSYYKI